VADEKADEVLRKVDELSQRKETLFGKMRLDACLHTLMTTKDPKKRKDTADELVKIGKGAVPDLIKLLKNKNEEVREAAVYALVKIGKGAIPDLIKALEREPMDHIIERLVFGEVYESKRAKSTSEVILHVLETIRRYAVLTEDERERTTAAIIKMKAGPITGSAPPIKKGRLGLSKLFRKV